MNPSQNTLLPKVTVAIPTLDRVGYLQLAVESALDQTYGNVEVVVSNNVSQDGTAQYLASCNDPRLRVLTQKTRLSMAANWNACLREATGEYFLLLSDDDLLEPQAIAEMVAAYTPQPGEPEPAMVYCGGSFIDSEGQVTVLFRHSPRVESARDLILAFLGGKRDLWFCAVLLRTADVRPHFPEDFGVGCDAAVWMRTVLRRGSAVFVPKQLVRYRQHHSLSCTTPLQTWRRDQGLLRAVIDEEDKRAGMPDRKFTARLDALTKEAELRTVIAWINHSLKDQRGRALLEYGRYAPLFFSPSGIYFLLRGLFALFLNEKGRLWMRRTFHKQPVVASHETA